LKIGNYEYDPQQWEARPREAEKVVNFIQEYCTHVKGDKAGQPLILDQWQIDNVINYFINQLGIVFYSHRVNYPMALSAQVLPPELKERVVRKLEMIKADILDYPAIQESELLKTVTLQQIQDNINFLEAKCMHDTHWQDCINFNLALDKTRGQSFLDANPEFKSYV